MLVHLHIPQMAKSKEHKIGNSRQHSFPEHEQSIRGELCRRLPFGGRPFKIKIIQEVKWFFLADKVNIFESLEKRELIKES